MAQAPYIEIRNKEIWENWHKSIRIGGEVEKYISPYNRYIDNSSPPPGKEFLPGLEGLRDIINRAEKEGAVVRAHGSKWSLNNVAFTSDFLVESKNLDYLKVGFEEEALVTAAYKDKKQFLSFVQCGVLVQDLNNALQAKEQALMTSGASDGQTLVGAVSTGTHGAANQFGSMTEFVRGIHLVTLGKHVFVQRATDQAMTPAFSQWLDNAEHVLDDDLFNAALVGFGSFGFVHGLVIETEPLYLLERHIINYDYSEVTNAIANLDMSGLNLPDGDKLPFHFEVALNPYHLGDGEKGAFVRVYYKRPLHENPEAKLRTHKEEEVDVHYAMAQTFDERRARVLDALSDDVPDGEGKSPRLKEIGLAVQLALMFSFPITPDGEKDLRYPGKFFTNKNSTKPTSSTIIPASSIEIGVPFDRVGDAVALIHESVMNHPFAAPLALRYVKKSSASIGFTSIADLTVTMEMPGPWGLFVFPRTGQGHQAIFNALADSDIPHAYHWGQQLPENNKWAPKIYGSALDLWKRKRSEFLGDAGLKMFTNYYIKTFLETPGSNPKALWLRFTAFLGWVRRLFKIKS